MNKRGRSDSSESVDLESLESGLAAMLLVLAMEATQEVTEAMEDMVSLVQIKSAAESLKNVSMNAKQKLSKQVWVSNWFSVDFQVAMATDLITIITTMEALDRLMEDTVIVPMEAMAEDSTDKMTNS